MLQHPRPRIESALPIWHDRTSMPHLGTTDALRQTNTIERSRRDRTGGIEAMRAANIPALAHPYTVGLAQAYGFPIPQPVAAC
jgi:hypothetical protein